MSSKVRAWMPSAVSVVARSYPDRIIGIENRLPWHLGTDLKHFKSLTQGHVIIMGRKTFESLGRPLPNRINIVLSKERVPDAKNLYWAQNPETALLLADFHTICKGMKEFFVIGGENIYAIFSEYINKVFLTEVSSGHINGDAKFDFDFPPEEWYFKYEREFPKSDIDDFPFRICCINRRKPQHRARFINEFKDRNKIFDVNWDYYSSQEFVSSEEDVSELQQLDFLDSL